jgi:protein-tyrosine phosphatase
MTARLRILLVCLGNICRSPTAEVVLRTKLEAAGLGDRFDIDSAGTYSGHFGLPPDARSQRHALRRGYDLSRGRARGIQPVDFQRFDLIFAMDDDNLADLQRMAPDGASARIERFAAVEVPDPYTSGPAMFEQVLDIVESASDAWVERLGQDVGTSGVDPDRKSRL